MPAFVLLDLEDVRPLARIGRRRRLKNLAQLERTLGRHASATDRLRFLRAYLGPDASRAERRAWARAVRCVAGFSLTSTIRGDPASS